MKKQNKQIVSTNGIGSHLCPRMANDQLHLDSRIETFQSDYRDTGEYFCPITKKNQTQRSGRSTNLKKQQTLLTRTSWFQWMADWLARSIFGSATPDPRNLVNSSLPPKHKRKKKSGVPDKTNLSVQGKDQRRIAKRNSAGSVTFNADPVNRKGAIGPTCLNKLIILTGQDSMGLNR